MLSPTDLVSLNRVQDLAVSTDGTWAAVVVDRLNENGSKYVSDLWRVDLLDGSLNQITRSEWNDTSPHFSGGSLYFLSNRPTEDEDKKHDKRSQVWRSDGVGDPKQITFAPLGVQQFKVSENGTLVYKTAVWPDVEADLLREFADKKKEEGPSVLRYKTSKVRYWDHWFPMTENRLVVAGEEVREIFSGEISVFALSDFGEDVYVLEPRRCDADRIWEGTIHRVDVSTGSIKTIWDKQRQNAFGLCAGDKKFAFLVSTRTDQGTKPWQVMEYDPKSGDCSDLIPGYEDRIRPACFDADGRLWLVGDQLGAAPVFSVADGELKQESASQFGGSHSHLAPFKNGMCGVRSTADYPPEVFTLESASDEPFVLTALSEYTRPDVSVENVHVESTDGTPIHVRHIRPNDDQKRPMLLWIHGGPLSVWGDVWHWRWNPVVAASFGYHVVCPNPRGSVGFGQQFVQDMFGDVWGGQCYEDVIAVADHSEARDDVDEGRTCAMGGSFGGYMTNWLGTQTDRFSCLVTHASIADNHAFYATTDGPAFWQYMFQQNPYEDRTAFDKYSPLRYVENWKTPVLIVHGDKDYRVPITEALTLFEALDFHDVDAELMVFPDENHWILKPKNAICWYEDIFEYIGKYTEG